jgi:hypothetical protein
MRPGTYGVRQVVVAGPRQVRIPIDMVIQPHQPDPSGLPLLIEAKSAGDFTNPNKRRKEESDKAGHLAHTFGPDVRYLLFLCGYFDESYLTYESDKGIDFFWEHRPEDLLRLGL